MTTVDNGGGQGDGKADAGGAAPGTLLTEGGDKKPAEGATGAAGDKKPAEGAPDTGDKKDAAGDKGKDAKDDKSKAAGAPEKYEDFKMPEGVAVDKAKLEAFVPIAKELDLSQEKAQKLVDFYAKAQSDAVTAQAEAWNKTTGDWLKAAKEDKEFGGAQMQQNLAHAAKFRDTFGTPELTKFLNDYKIGDHPEMVRLFVKAGKAMDEDKFHSGNARETGAKQSQADILYPSMKSGA